MLNVLAERVANRWIEVTDDPEIKAIKEIDFGGFLDQIIAFITQLLPLFADFCPTNQVDTKARAAAWAAAAAGGRKARRKLGLVERWRLRRWERRVDSELGDIGEEFSNDELREAILQVAAEATADELTQLRAEADRARDEAA